MNPEEQNKNESRWSRLSPYASMIAAAGMALCILGSLSGYTPPVYGEEDPSSQVEEVTESEEPEESAVAQGDFDVEDGVYEGTGVGFAGDVKVSVTVKDHTITDIQILSTSDTESFFNRAKEGVISEILSQQSYDVDAVSGATYSSRGIMNAVKNALTGEKDTSSAASSSSSGTSSSGSATITTITEPDVYKDGTYTGSAQGFSGTVTVRVTVSGGKITDISVVSNSDTPAYFAKAKGVISKILSAQSTNVDGVSGATYSSNGIINAVRRALSQAAASGSSDTGSDTTDTGSETDSTSTRKEVEQGEEGTFNYEEGIYTGTAAGRNGDITVAVAIQDKTIKAIIVQDESEDEPFFTNARQVLKDIVTGQTLDVDAVSGATLSSNGLINAVKNALSMATEASDEEKKKYESQTFEDGVYEGSANGYAGLVKVRVTVEDGKITEIKVLSNSDTSSFFNRATTVIDTMIENQTTEVDGVSGATYSSRGIINAVKNALTGEVSTDQPVASDDDDDVEIEVVEDPEGYKDGVYEGSAEGFSGTVKVQVTVEDGKITDITVLDHSDTSSYFNRAQKGVVPDIIDGQTTNVDAVSGASYSSRGIINAVRDALGEAASDDSGDDDDEKKEVEKGNFPYPDGVYQGTGEGMNDDITVAVTIEDETITDITIVSQDDDEPFITNAESGVTKSILSGQTVEVDAVAGATYSSNGIISAVKDALSAAKSAAEKLDDDSKDPEDSGSDGKYTDGTYEGTGEGMNGDIKVSVTIEDGKITDITVTEQEEDKVFYNSAVVILDDMIDEQTADVDGVSGATYSSDGLKEAVSDALAKASSSSDDGEGT